MHPPHPNMHHPHPNMYPPQPHGMYPQPPQHERKIISNPAGMFVTSFVILICLLGIALGVYQLRNFINKTAYITLDESILKVVFFLGAHYVPLVGIHKRETFEEYLVMSAFAAYILLSVTHLYLPLRSFIEPKFSAGKPPVSQVWPSLAAAAALKIFYEAVFWKYSVYQDIFIFLSSTIPSVLFIFLMYSYYTRDDDAPSNGAINPKPWILEPIGLPKY